DSRRPAIPRAIRVSPGARSLARATRAAPCGAPSGPPARVRVALVRGRAGARLAAPGRTVAIRPARQLPQRRPASLAGAQGDAPARAGPARQGPARRGALLRRPDGRRAAHARDDARRGARGRPRGESSERHRIAQAGRTDTRRRGARRADRPRVRRPRTRRGERHGALGGRAAGLEAPDAEPLLRLTRGAHVAVPRQRLGHVRAMTLTSPLDGRVMFVLPWGDLSYIGTTDTDDDTSPDDVRATGEDVVYLLRSANWFFPTA